MTFIRHAIVLAALLLACAPLPASAASAPREEQKEGIGDPPPKLKVSDGLFVTVPDHQVLGAFTITNNDPNAQLITGFSSPACQQLSLVQWDGSPPNVGPLQLTVPGKGRMVFLRGGYHLHCEKPTRPINVGDTVPVTVDFRHLPSVTATFEVKPLSQPSVAR